MDVNTGTNTRNGERAKRHKVPIACDLCRLKKIKCDGVRPVCGTCARRRSRKNINCSWNPPNFHGQQSPSVVSTSPSERHQEREEFSASRHQDFLQEQSQNLQHHGISDRAHASASGIIGLLHEETPSEAFFGSSSAGSFINQLRKAVNINSSAMNSRFSEKAKRPSNSESSIGHLDQTQPELTLPTRSRADQLFQIYWEVVFPLYPFVDRQEITRMYSSLWVGRGKDDQLFHCLLNVIFALSCQLNAAYEPQSREKLSRVYFHRAKQLLDPWAIGTFQSVQIHLLLSLYFQSSNEPHHCWTMVGAAIRTAQSLGLHLPDTSEHVASPQKRELFRKVWYGCILMDRITSTVFGRPLIISSAFAVAVPRPLAVDEEQLVHVNHAEFRSAQDPSTMEFFICILDLFDILYDLLATQNFASLGVDLGGGEAPERFLDCLGADNSLAILNIERRFIKWEQNLPSHLKLNSMPHYGPKQKIFVRQAVIIHQWYLHVRLISLRPALSAYVFSETRQLDTSIAFGGRLMQKVALQCAVVCVTVAQEAISLAYDRRPLIPTSIGSVSEWWYNVLFTYSAAIVLIAAKICPSILAEISEPALDRSWGSAISLMEHYQGLHPVITQVLAAAKLLHSALPKHHQRAKGLDLSSTLDEVNSNAHVLFEATGALPDQSRSAINDPMDLIEGSQMEASAMPDGFGPEDFEFDFNFNNHDLAWLHTAPFEL